MSLLMQALKKAERAKQNHHGDEEVAKPSEAFDAVLELAPQEPLAPPAAPTALSLDPLPEPVAPADGLSLSPLDPVPQAAPAPQPLPPQPAPQEALLDFVPAEPAPAPASAAQPEPVRASVEAPPPPPPPPPQARRRNPPPPPPPPRVRPKAAAPVLSARAIRLSAIGAGALVVAATLAYIYWHEMYGPGSSRHLPPVPMPGQNLPPAPAPAAPQLSAPPGLDDAAAPPRFSGAAEPGAPATLEADDPTSAPPPAGAAPPSASAAEDVPPSSPDPRAPSPREQAMGMSPREQAMGMSPREQAMGMSPREQAMGMSPREQAMGMSRGAAAARGTASAPSGDGAQREAQEIRVARASNPEQINPGVAAGYSAYQRGELAAARSAYQDALRRDPHNRDALLGLAAIALRAGDAEQAANHYTRLLDMNPDDAEALAGIAALRADGESRLRQALERNPDSAAASFALGNLYARQGRWQDAQQHYFRAYTGAPNHPDYAYNLAVGLDRLNQPRLAQTYYRRALELAGGAGTGRPVGFDLAAAGQRLRELAGSASE